MKKWGPHTPYFIVVMVALALPTLNLFDTLAFRCIPMAMTHHGQRSPHCADVSTVIYDGIHGILWAFNVAAAFLVLSTSCGFKLRGSGHFSVSGS